MWRSIAAVVFGYLITGLLIVITDQIFELTIPGFRQMAMPPDFYFATSIVTDALYSAAGGWLCAVIAKRRVRRSRGRSKFTCTICATGRTIYTAPWTTVRSAAEKACC